MAIEGLSATVVETTSSQRWAATRPELSVLVSTFRRPHYLAGLFDAFEAQDLDGARFEIVVVDNASADTTWDVLRERAGRSPLAICVARVPHNNGPASGRNAAVSLARAPFIVFTDDDCLPESQWLSSMLDAFNAGARVAQGRTEAEPGVPRTTWDHTITIRKPSALFETCNLGYRRSDVIDAGGFQPLAGYRPGRGGAPFGGEDTVLGWKITRATRVSVTFVDDAVVYHRIEPRDFRGWLRYRHGINIFPALLSPVPELRNELFLRFFISSRSAAFDLAAVSAVAAVAVWSAVPLVGVVPYLWMLAPRRRGLRSWAGAMCRYAIGDATAAWSLVQGSFRQRRVVL